MTKINPEINSLRFFCLNRTKFLNRRSIDVLINDPSIVTIAFDTVTVTSKYSLCTYLCCNIIEN